MGKDVSMKGEGMRYEGSQPSPEQVDALLDKWTKAEAPPAEAAPQEQAPSVTEPGVWEAIVAYLRDKFMSKSGAMSPHMRAIQDAEKIMNDRG